MKSLPFVMCTTLVGLGSIYGQAFSVGKLTIKPSTRLQLVASVDPTALPEGKILIKLKLKNVSSKTVILSDSEPKFDYRIAVADASGKEPVLTEWGKKMAAGELAGLRQSELHLGPGEEAQVTVEVQGYQLEHPGTYYARVTRLGVWAESDEDNKKFAEVVYSNPVQFTVAP